MSAALCEMRSVKIRINFGTLFPGEKPVTFNDALNCLSNEATYLHNDTGKYWYSTTASLNKLAADNAKAFDENIVFDKVNEKLFDYFSKLNKSIFEAIHCNPGSTADIPDYMDGVRIVVFGAAKTHTTGSSASPAVSESEKTINFCGNTPRVFKNTLLFLAPDNRALDNLKDATRKLLAWEEIVKHKDKYNLTVSDLNKSESNLSQNENLVLTRLKETWSWLIYPSQNNANDNIVYETKKMRSYDNIFEKIRNRLEEDSVLYSNLGPN